MKNISLSTVRLFQKKVYDHYRTHGRDLPWRRTKNPYRILVAEIMLQQTQVERVSEKYPEFLTAYPDFESLAGAPLQQLLGLWQGMGYNRRALLLRRLAQEVVSVHRGKLPSDPEVLIGLPGVGNYTTGAVMAFAFNRPVVFMDTNIRRVYIDEFFADREKIRDGEIAPLLRQTLDAENRSEERRVGKECDR
jgi:A/G-specific adenine glycosylase